MGSFLEFIMRFGLFSHLFSSLMLMFLSVCGWRMLWFIYWIISPVMRSLFLFRLLEIDKVGSLALFVVHAWANLSTML